MAIELITKKWCDVHMQKDEHIEGDTVTVSLNGDRVQQVELCPDCVGELVTPLQKVLESEGRNATKGGRPPTSRRGGTSALVDTKPSSAVDCPIKGCSYKSTRSNLRGHIESNHSGTSLAQEETKLGMTLEGVKLEHFCDAPGCGLGYVNATSLGVHKSRAHS